MNVRGAIYLNRSGDAPLSVRHYVCKFENLGRCTIVALGDTSDLLRLNGYLLFRSPGPPFSFVEKTGC